MADIFEKVYLLKRAPAFAGVNTEDLRVLAQELREESCHAGERLFDLNDPPDNVYIISQGSIGISIEEDPASRNFVAVLGPGECFGEMSVLDGLPRSATAHVLEDTVLYALAEAKLRGLIVQYPELALGLLRSMSRRLREVTRRIT